MLVNVLIMSLFLAREIDRLVGGCTCDKMCAVEQHNTIERFRLLHHVHNNVITVQGCDAIVAQ